MYILFDGKLITLRMYYIRVTCIVAGKEDDDVVHPDHHHNGREYA